MGSRGPQPTPTSILNLRGSWRGKTRNGEPRPDSGLPETPEHLTNPQKQVWNQLCGMLDAMGVLTVVDGFQIERYAVYLVRWRLIESASLKFATDENTLSVALLKDESRTIVRNLWRESHLLDAALKQIESQFGLSPASRTRISAKDEEFTEEDNFLRPVG